ncbi:MAG: DUF4093 domain-containing protein, partial [Clostridia bacterium]|nr:DUF4093 domain-containing protein [Clostridia bacterium]
MLKISKPIIVEGKYDRARVLSVAEATVISTDGFGIFKKSETAALIKKLAERRGIIVLTDSDGAGLVIRNYIKNITRGADMINVYVPQIKGKEKRKKTPSKEGYLGVEGMEREIVEKALAPFDDGGDGAPKMSLTKADFYALGLSGKDSSAERRRALARVLGLPQNISASALIEAINL